MVSVQAGCDICGDEHTVEECPELQKAASVVESKARATIPGFAAAVGLEDGTTTIVATKRLAAKTTLGEYEAKFVSCLDLTDETHVFVLKAFLRDGSTVYLDTSNEQNTNWLSLVQTASTAEEQNCMALQIGSNVHYMTTKDINPGQPLLVWYAAGYAQKLQRPAAPDGKTETLLTLTNQTNCGQDVKDKSGVIILSVSENDFQTDKGLSRLLATSSEMMSRSADGSQPESARKYKCTYCGLEENNDIVLAMHIKEHLLLDRNPKGRKPAAWRGRVSLISSETNKNSDEKVVKRKRGRPSKKETETRENPVEQISPSESDAEDMAVRKSSRIQKKTKENKNYYREKLESYGILKRTAEKKDSVRYTRDALPSLDGADLLAIKAEKEQDIQDVDVDDEGRGNEAAPSLTQYDEDDVDKDDAQHDVEDDNDGMNDESDATADADKKMSVTQMSNGNYRCEFCDTYFLKRKYLLMHMSAHTREFTCEVCGRAFSRKESLQRHLIHCNPQLLMEGQYKAYPCMICKRVFTQAHSLQNHQRVHEGIFKCEACRATFATENALRAHNCEEDVVALGLASEEDDGTYRCKECGQCFKQKIYLKRHMPIHTGEFACIICKKAYSRKDELIKHMLVCMETADVNEDIDITCSLCNEHFLNLKQYVVHYQEHTRPFRCDACGKMFLRKINMDNHKCKPDLMIGSRECDVCGKKFSNMRCLVRRMDLHENPKYHCDDCKKSFHRQDAYLEHTCLDEVGNKVRVKVVGEEKIVVPAQESSICSICGKYFVNIRNMMKHMKTHGEKKEICGICGKKFHFAVYLKEHIKWVHTKGTYVQCPHCQKQLKGRNSLYFHIAQFHTDAPSKYPCSHCGKVFRQKGNLKKHELIHSDKKTFECRYCDKHFKFPEQIRRHELWHVHGMRYACSLCDKKFVMEFELRTHLNGFHGGTAYVCCYCKVSCHYYETMKRHLHRRHMSISEWQVDKANFIKSLQVQTDGYINVQSDVDQTENSTVVQFSSANNTVMDLADIQQDQVIAIDAQEVEGQEGGAPQYITVNADSTVMLVTDLFSGSEATTVIIRPDGTIDSNAVISQEAAEVLQSLSSQGYTNVCQT